LSELYGELDEAEKLSQVKNQLEEFDNALTIELPDIDEK
jgi:hypothetical protein